LGFGLTPSPLRGEGWDEEWFKNVLNAANLTPALSLKRRGSKAKPSSKSVLLLPLKRGRLGGGIAENSVAYVRNTPPQPSPK
jgi:hypothetical protein